MEDRPLRVGDCVEWTGPSHGPLGAGPQHGERGWLIIVDPADDIIVFDVCGHQSANYTHGANNELEPEHLHRRLWIGNGDVARLQLQYPPADGLFTRLVQGSGRRGELQRTEVAG
jgi:hypothetical protein